MNRSISIARSAVNNLRVLTQQCSDIAAVAQAQQANSKWKSPSASTILSASSTCRCLSTSKSLSASQSPNQDYVVSPVYHNRNPRNLEKMALARKRLGWKLTAPRKDYYHKLILTLTHRHTEALLEHSSGEKILTASTREWAIRNQLYSCTDVSASENVGRVMASRCLESGITEVFFDKSQVDINSERVSRFLQGFWDLGIALSEPDVIEPEDEPGINYDGYNRYAEPKQWQDDYQKE